MMSFSEYQDPNNEPALDILTSIASTLDSLVRHFGPLVLTSSAQGTALGVNFVADIDRIFAVHFPLELKGRFSAKVIGFLRPHTRGGAVKHEYGTPYGAPVALCAGRCGAEAT